MRLLSLLHRWTGGVLGLLFAVIGLSGTALLWEEAWISLPGADAPYTASTPELADVVEAATTGERQLSRITFGSEGMALHLAIYEDGGGAYFDQSAQVVDSWGSVWGRPELWLFDLHHHLFSGRTGERVTGVLGLLLLGFAISGAILWWRTRRTFRPRLWPARMTRSAIVRQHRDLGVVAAPLLMLSATTGALMVFHPLAEAVLAPWSDESASPAEPPEVAGVAGPETDWRALLANAQAAFPGAVPRRLQLPREPGRPVLLRMRQDFEWTPNGRTYVYLDPADSQVVATEDPAAGDAAAAIEEKFYPIHSAKVGGVAWRLALTFSGLTLVLLGSLASWSFWFRRREGKAVSRPPPAPFAATPAE